MPSLDTLNKQVSLSDVKGKYVLLNFWATSCGPGKGTGILSIHKPLN